MRLLLGLLAIFFLPGTVIAFWDGLQFLIHDHKLLDYMLIGIGTGAFFYFLLIRRWNYFLTWEHELTHAVMSLFFFRKINKFVATRRNGGVVYHSGGFGGEFGNVMITLAPYYFPTFTVILILFQPLVPQKFTSIYIILVGFTLIFHHLSTLRELKNNWTSGTFPEAGSGNILSTDIASSGFLFSFIFILAMTLLFNAMIFWMLKYSYGGFIPMFKGVFTDSLTIFKSAFFKIQHIIR